MDSTPVQFRSHTALLLAAALPYLQPAYRQPVELAMKFMEFSETIQYCSQNHLPKTEALHALHNAMPADSLFSGITELIYRFVRDPEGLLTTLSPICTEKEKNIVGLLLNLFQAKNFYENYGDMFQSFMSAGFSKEEASPESAGPEGGLSSMMNEEQLDTLNLLKSLLSEDERR